MWFFWYHLSEICLPMIPFMPIIVAVQFCKGCGFGDKLAGNKVIWNKYADNEIFQTNGK